ncbi:MAG: hypothetical protein Q8N90_00245 [bacterium]|nr:hypothetical protein [bacterium]
MKNYQKTNKQNPSEKLRHYARMFAELLIEELIRQKEIKINSDKTNKIANKPRFRKNGLDLIVETDTLVSNRK